MCRTSPSKQDDAAVEATPSKPKRYHVPEAKDSLQILQSTILHSTQTTFLSPVASSTHGHGHTNDHSPTHDTVGLVRRHPGRKDQHENHHEIVVSRHHAKHQSNVIPQRRSAPKESHSSGQHADENNVLSAKIASELQSVQQERQQEESQHGRHSHRSGHHSGHHHHSHDRRQTL